MPGAFWDLIAKDQASPAFLRVAGAADKAAASTERASKSIGGATARMSAVGARLTKSVTLPLLAIAGVSVKLATDFNSAMTRIQTQAGASASDVKTLSAQVLSLSKTAQQGPVDLANALYHLKSVGLDNVMAMKALKTSSDLAAVGNANLEATTNALAGAWRTGIQGAKNFHTAAATVNAVIGAGNMTLEAFNAALGTGILASAKTFGLSLKDVGSALALFTDEGVPADAAATRLRMTFSLLGAPSKAAEAQLNAIGLTGLRLADDMRKPNGLIAAIGDLKAHLEDPKYKLSLSEQAQLLSHAFGGGRSSSAILSLINNFAVLKQKQDQVTSSLSKYDKAVAAQRATPGAQFHELVANLERTAITLGTAILPDVKALAGGLSTAAQWFARLNTATHGWLIAAGGIALLAGPVLSLTAKIAGAAGAIRLFSAGAAQATLATKEMTSASYLAGRNMAGGFGGAMGVAARAAGKLTAAIGGVGLGLAIGQMTKNMSTGAKLLGALGAAAAGAMIGFQVGGGPGAVIGATTGAITSLATSMSGAATVTIDATAAYQTYIATVKQSTNALSNANQEQTVANLANSHAYDLLDQLHSANLAAGVSYNDLIAAVNGGPKAFNAFTAAMRGTHNILGTFMINEVAQLRTGFQQAITAQKELNRSLADHAISGFVNAVRKGSEMLPRFDGGIQSLGTALSKTSDYTESNVTAFEKLQASMKVAQLTGKDLTDALAGVIATVGKSATATLNEFLGAVQSFVSSGKSAADRAALIGATLKNANGDALNFAGAMNSASGAAHQLGVDVKSAAKAVGKSGESTHAWLSNVVNMKTGAINFHKAAAGPLITDLQSIQTAGMNAAMAMFQHARATMSGKRAADAAYRVYKQQTYGALVSEFTQLTGNATAAKKLATNYLGMPKHVKTLLEQEGGDPIVTLLNKIGTQLAFLTGHPWTPKIDANTKPATDKANRLQSTIDAIKQGKFPDLGVNSAAALQTIASLQARIDNLRGKTLFINTVYNPGTGPNRAIPSARGTIVRGPGTGTSDTAGLYALSNGEAVIPEKAVSKHRGMVEYLIAQGRGMSNGGITTKQSNGKTVYVYHGTDYSTRKSAVSARDSNLIGAIGTSIGNIGSAPGAKFHVGDVGMNRILGQINHAWDVLRVKIAAGLSKNAARTYEKELRHYTAIARHQLHDLRVQIRTSDLHDIKKALGGTVQDTRAAFTAMFHDLTKAGGASAKMLNALHAGEARLIAQQKTLAQRNRQLDKMRTYRSGVRSTLSGAFDPTQYGSIQDLIGGLHSATGTNNAYSSEVTKLRREAHGNKGLLRMINTLDASGQTATLATLAHASRGQFLQAGKAYQHYQGSLTAGSNAAEVTKFGRSIDSWTKEMQAERKDRREMVAAMAKVVHAVTTAHVKLDGKVVGTIVSDTIDHDIAELEKLIRHGQHHH